MPVHEETTQPKLPSYDPRVEVLQEKQPNKSKRLSSSKRQ